MVISSRGDADPESCVLSAGAVWHSFISRECILLDPPQLAFRPAAPEMVTFNNTTRQYQLSPVNQRLATCDVATGGTWLLLAFVFNQLRLAIADDGRPITETSCAMTLTARHACRRSG